MTAYIADREWLRTAALILAARPGRVLRYSGTWIVDPRLSSDSNLPTRLSPDLIAALTDLYRERLITVLRIADNRVVTDLTESGCDLLVAAVDLDLVRVILAERLNAKQAGDRLRERYGFPR